MFLPCPPIIEYCDFIAFLISPHHCWKKFSRENVQGVERSGDKHFTQGSKRHSTSNETLTNNRTTKLDLFSVTSNNRESMDWFSYWMRRYFATVERAWGVNYFYYFYYYCCCCCRCYYYRYCYFQSIVR